MRYVFAVGLLLRELRWRCWCNICFVTWIRVSAARTTTGTDSGAALCSFNAGDLKTDSYCRAPASRRTRDARTGQGRFPVNALSCINDDLGCLLAAPPLAALPVSSDEAPSSPLGAIADIRAFSWTFPRFACYPACNLPLRCSRCTL